MGNVEKKLFPPEKSLRLELYKCMPQSGLNLAKCSSHVKEHIQSFN